jgi:hypothetical protein
MSSRRSTLYTYDRRPKFDPARIRPTVGRRAAIGESGGHREQPARWAVLAAR